MCLIYFAEVFSTAREDRESRKKIFCLFRLVNKLFGLLLFVLLPPIFPEILCNIRKRVIIDFSNSRDRCSKDQWVSRGQQELGDNIFFLGIGQK